MSNLDVVFLGERSIADWPCFAAPEMLPAAARLVVVGRPHDADLEALRLQVPDARWVAWVDAGAAADIDALLQRGFDDVAVGETHLQQRIRMDLHELRIIDEYSMRVEGELGLERLMEEISRQPSLQDVLRVAVLRLSQLFSIDRVSVVLWKPGAEVGFVVMEREQSLDNVAIRIEDYPELMEIIRSRKPLVISDVFGDELLAGVRSKLQSAGVHHRSSVLFPLQHNNDVVGALFLRSGTPMLSVEERLLTMGTLISTATSVAIGHALEHDLLVDEQRALIRDRDDASRELQTLRQFSGFFEHAHDGIVITDAEGAIRYANRSAGSILSRSPDELKGMMFLDLISPHSHVLAERALSGDDVGDGYGYVDLLVPCGDDAELVISAAIRRIGDPQSVLVSFRDVTELREIESELRQTKEFLENLIQSSVDGIVAADIDGRIILFNRGAEQIVGYTAREMVGKMNVKVIYPPGEAQDVMRRLRMEAYGGAGRLEVVRKELVAKNGELVPVNMTAAIIYEGDQEVATVGIFTDLRDRMRMEEKLMQVQNRLQVSERQAVAVELAGAAAHELNQPLTSILGYAEMLKRRVPEDDPNRKPVNVICRETERMAGIVRKIGQITAYETKPYVGGSKILDLSPSGSSADGESQKE